MRTNDTPLIVALAAVASVAAFGQGRGQPLAPERTPGVQAQSDPKREAFVAANCKTPPAPANFGRGRGAPPAASTQPYGLLEYTIQEIPGIIAAGQRWKVLWEGKGNNADGIIALDDGGVLSAQADNSTILKIDKDGKASILYTDTYAAGSVAINPQGQWFVGERALHEAVWLFKPERKLFANTFKGEPFDCFSPGPLNDMVADSKGGVYLTMNGVWYVNPKGEAFGRWGPSGANGIILSPDERTLYVTGRVGNMPGSGLVAFDVQSDGLLTHERQFADVCGDGMTVDAQGRIYCTESPLTGRGEQVTIVGADGKVIGRIPTPRPVISLAFGGPGKKTLFAATNEAVANGRESKIFSIPMIAEGYKKRVK
jgi:gluconolactonase